MIEFGKIKLIIWDLDETFWKGTVSEENIVIPEQNRELVIRLTDIGIINAICSKNDYEQVKKELIHEGLWDYFVFPSVNWDPKGGRVRQLIEDMQLRSANVLFLDDNPSNREEVRYFCPEIMVDGPDVIPELYKLAFVSDKEDYEHKRLKQYRILEEKKQEKSRYVSNEEFLKESNIKVIEGKNCMAHIDRIHDLLLRSNQLNFTKVRPSEEELRMTLQDESVDAGYVHVSDRFGDYGLVGFYAVRGQQLIHFAFSCRILGMGVEQYVYNRLGRPKLIIAGEVISDLSSEVIPEWINQSEEQTKTAKLEIADLTEHMVLIKGPCDLYQIYPFIADTDLFDTEFTYTTPQGLVIESTGHTTNIVEAGRLSEQQKKTVLQEVPFTDAGMYDDRIFRNPYKVVFISILTDANLGVYRRRETGEKFAFLEYLYPLTDKKNWAGYIDGSLRNCGVHFTKEMLTDFNEKYEFLGRNTSAQVIDNLKYIREHLDPECQLVIMLGGELPYEKNTLPAYADRHIVHKEINEAVRHYAETEKKISLLDVNPYLTGQDCFYDHFNHYIKPVYYQLAVEMVEMINTCTGSRIHNASKLKIKLMEMKEAAGPVYGKVRKYLKKRKR